MTYQVKKWCINISGIVGVLTVLGGLFVFLLGYNDRIVRVEVAVIQVVSQLSGLRDDLSQERDMRREDNQEARALSRMDNQDDRQKMRNSNAQDRAKSQAARDIDFDKQANRKK